MEKMLTMAVKKNCDVKFCSYRLHIVGYLDMKTGKQEFYRDENE